MSHFLDRKEIDTVAEFKAKEPDVLEELSGLEGLELVDKQIQAEKFKFPVTYVGKNFIYYNHRALPYVADWKRVRYYVNTDYIVILPAKSGTADSFSVYHNGSGISTVKPGNLVARQPQQGYYKLMRYKDGLAWKRHEPINPPQ